MVTLAETAITTSQKSVNEILRYANDTFQMKWNFLNIPFPTSFSLFSSYQCIFDTVDSK